MPIQSSESAPQNLHAGMKEISWFKQILARVQEIQRFQRVLKECLDLELAQHCHFLAIEKATLLLEAESAVWAARVRYSAPELVKILKKYPEFAGVKKVRCSVRPAPTPTLPRKLSPPNPITPESANCIAEIANGIEDQELRRALLRLASTRNKN